jgi:uncharacterized protein (TIGR03437 family)
VTVKRDEREERSLYLAVETDMVAPAPPLSYVRADQFTAGPPASVQTLPLGTTLGGATVYVNDVAAPVYYVSASHVTNPSGQITFQIPCATPPGSATVRVDRSDNGVVQKGNTIGVQIVGASPRLLQFNLNAIADHT